DEEFAYLQLVRHLDGMCETPLDLELPLSRAAMLLSKALLGGFGRAEAPKPGHLHVVPLENAGFSGRKHLFVVGLHADALSANPVAEPFVPQQADAGDESAADRAALGGSTLPSGHPADLNLWLAVRALARASESVTLSHPVLDPVADDPLEPSPLFLRARWRAKGDLKQETPIFRIAHGTNRLASAGAIDGTEYAILLGRSAAEPRPNEAARRLLAEQFPGAAQGLESRRQKDNPEILTEHDGWIGEPGAIHHGDLESLNLFGEDALSATRLQTLATCPHKYFLRYVLGLKPAEEPPDEDEWLDALQRGDVLHQIFRRFMESLSPGQRPTAADEDTLQRVFEEVLAEREATYPPPDSAVGRKTRNRLWEAIGIFFQTELAQEGYEPVAFELGFGNEPDRRHEHPPGYPEDHTGPLTLDLPGLPPIRVKGYVDRVDRALDGKDAGRFAVWDYKTGSSKKFVDKSDPLDEGRLIQPHLYAHALREAFGWDVAKTGFSFPTVRENGYREEYPVASAERLAGVINDLSVLPPAGFFVQAPNAENCTYCDYREACGPYAERKKVIAAAATAAREDAEHPASDVLEKWNYL
ncbi:MAG: PD-(D/E)XK nuclease family protein, partial [Bacteroidetes bacterium]|nr:PD-(D/E)XK nuclease family protein [Bacteroidota bacterium]